MKRKHLPAAPEADIRMRPNCFIPPSVMDRWNPLLQAAAEGGDSDNTISIYDAIGESFWEEGVTVKRIDAALRHIGTTKDVVVNINSPGGDVFEGLAIYNRLREHKGKVTVKVLGIAASAASLIAMAGSEIQIGRAAFLMVHNTWLSTFGNRHDLRATADWIEPFDETLADVYARRSELDIEEVRKSLDAETWIGGKEAVELGWADSLLESDEVVEEKDSIPKSKLAARKLDVLMAKEGIPRSERRAMMQAIKSDTPCAIDPGMPGATEKEIGSLAVSIETLTNIRIL